MTRSFLLLLAATIAAAAAYLQPARPVQLPHPKWDAAEPKLSGPARKVTQPPLSEKTLWERALERQEWETLQHQQPPPPAPPRDTDATRCATKRRREAASWERLAALAAEGAIARGKILAVNAGGVVCRVHGRKAFCPNSHLGAGPARVGQELPLRILRAHAAARRLVVSSREAHRAALAQGDLIRGTVTSHASYGCFVTFGGGLRGLLHRRHVSANGWKLVPAPGPRQGFVVDDCFRHANEMAAPLLQVGSKVACLVTGHNRDNGRISLSTRALEGVPGELLRDPAGVFARAEAAAAGHEERRDRELLEYEALASMCEENHENSLSALLNDLLP